MTDQRIRRALTVGLLVCVAGCTAATNTPSPAPSSASDRPLGVLYVSQQSATSASLVQVCLDTRQEKEVFSTDQMPIVDIPQVATNPDRILFAGQQDGYMGSLYLIENNQAQSFLPNTYAGYTPRWSPDGKQVLFNGMTAADPTNPEIFLSNVDGTLTNVTNNPSSDFFPSWSPDGQSFVFISTRDGSTDVFLASLNDNTAINLTNDPAEDNVAMWSPDGRWISFLSERTGSRRLYVMDVENAYAVSLLDESATEDILNYSWSPDSAHIAATYGDRETSGLSLLTLADKSIVPISDFVGKKSSLPAWSPDSQQLVWTSNATGRYQIYLSDKTGANRQQITNSPGDAIYPTWIQCDPE